MHCLFNRQDNLLSIIPNLLLNVSIIYVHLKIQGVKSWVVISNIYKSEMCSTHPAVLCLLLVNKFLHLERQSGISSGIF